MPSSLKDNRPTRGSVGEFLRSQIKPETNLSFVSAYFTVSASDALKPELEAAESLRFLFGETDHTHNLFRTLLRELMTVKPGGQETTFERKTGNH